MGSNRAPQWKRKQNDRFFRSADERFGVSLRGTEIRQILKYCIEAGPLETGGILVGKYTEDHGVALVSDASKAPGDSKSGTTWFYRGIAGLQAWLHRLWDEERYYLGEWHFHPGTKPVPSDTDLRQIREIAELPKYNCPEPILLIVGADPTADWQIAVYVSPRTRSLVSLNEREENGLGPRH